MFANVGSHPLGLCLQPCPLASQGVPEATREAGVAATLAHVPPPEEEHFLRSREDTGTPLRGAERVATTGPGPAPSRGLGSNAAAGECASKLPGQTSSASVWRFAVLSKNTFQGVSNEEGAPRGREGLRVGSGCRLDEFSNHLLVFAHIFFFFK